MLFNAMKFHAMHVLHYALCFSYLLDPLLALAEKNFFFKKLHVCASLICAKMCNF